MPKLHYVLFVVPVLNFFFPGASQTFFQGTSVLFSLTYIINSPFYQVHHKCASIYKPNADDNYHLIISKCHNNYCYKVLTI